MDTELWKKIYAHNKKIKYDREKLEKIKTALSRLSAKPKFADLLLFLGQLRELMK